MVQSLDNGDDAFANANQMSHYWHLTEVMSLQSFCVVRPIAVPSCMTVRVLGRLKMFCLSGYRLSQKWKHKLSQVSQYLEKQQRKWTVPPQKKVCIILLPMNYDNKLCYGTS